MQRYSIFSDLAKFTIMRKCLKFVNCQMDFAKWVTCSISSGKWDTFTFSVDCMAICIVQMATNLLTKEARTSYGTSFVLQWVVPFIINYENFNSFMQYRRGAQLLCKGTEGSYGSARYSVRYPRYFGIGQR